ncbi:methionine/alanine import family NSS transporter small subunit [Streptomyces diacarni]|uniref:Methionine/alanine import family NSS transporter small subunit n=1 Tax=Streptomyces diacarni TaxID=2800381 RepID=A0A367F9Q1_9ACTN|nr:methionine/alanine import family NSS transporter small subunit [Streptomyces diacarni]
MGDRRRCAGDRRPDRPRPLAHRAASRAGGGALMSAGAVVMMTAAILIVWGGLIAAVLRLRRHPDPE